MFRRIDFYVLVTVAACWFVMRTLSGDAIPNELLVKFQAEENTQEVDNIAARFNLKETAQTRDGRIKIFRAESAESYAQFRQSIHRHFTVEYVQPHHIFYLADTYPDDLSSQQWNLHNYGQAEGPVDVDIDAPGAWDFTTGSDQVVIAVIDTGIDMDHPDLMNNLWINTGETPDNGIDDDSNGYIDDVKGWNFKFDTNDPNDQVGHGSAVAGVIGSVGNNGIGISGINWNCSLMALNSYGEDNSTGEIYLIQAIDYAIDNGARIINASWGDVVYSQALMEAVQRASNAGVLFCAAAGNNAVNIDRAPFYPASLSMPLVLSAGSIGSDDRTSDFSNWGRNNVHVLAPGSQIYTIDINGGYRVLSGTSFSVPHASGLAALLWSVYPVVSADYIRGKIIGSTLPLPHYAEDATSPGRLNILRPFQQKYSLVPAPTDLHLVRAGFNGAELEFTVPYGIGDEVPRLYDIRIDKSPITENGFFKLNRLPNIPLPDTPGFVQPFALTDLEESKEWYVAMKVLDQWGNYSEMSNVVNFQTQHSTDLFTYDVESDPAGWIVEGDWHRTTDTVRSGSYSWSMVDGETYMPNQNFSLISPPVDLSGVAEPVLEFYHRFRFFPSGLGFTDGGWVEVSNDDGVTWRTLEFFIDWHEPWCREQVMLQEAGGHSKVRFRFRFESDKTLEAGPGWFIDDIRVLDGVNRVTKPRRLILGGYHRFLRVNEPPLYEEKPPGQWRLQRPRTTLSDAIPHIARATDISDGLLGRATLTPWFPASGRYMVYAAWGEEANAANVAIIIRHNFGTNMRYIDQNGLQNGNNWIRLGEYYFNFGQDAIRGSVSMDEGSVSGPVDISRPGQMHFDLLRFDLLEEGDPNELLDRDIWFEDLGDTVTWFLY